MGYYTSFSGSFYFSRPLTYAEIKQIDVPSLLELITEEDEQETEAGPLKVITATGFHVGYADEIKGYDIDSEMNALASSLPSDVILGGVIRGEGEDAGDVRRYVVKDNGSIECLRPRLVWSDGYEEEGRR